MLKLFAIRKAVYDITGDVLRNAEFYYQTQKTKWNRYFEKFDHIILKSINTDHFKAFLRDRTLASVGREATQLNAFVMNLLIV